MTCHILRLDDNWPFQGKEIDSNNLTGNMLENHPVMHFEQRLIKLEPRKGGYYYLKIDREVVGHALTTDKSSMRSVCGMAE